MEQGIWTREFLISPELCGMDGRLGVLGGLTNGMPVVCRVVIKPTASIAKEQHTVSLKRKTEETLVVKGRHDPCIVQRAVPVLESVMALGLADLLLGRCQRKGWNGQ